MRIRVLRLLAVVAVLALALPAAGLGARRDRATDRGVVQSVDTVSIVLRALDGSVVSFAVTPGTRVKVNGARAQITDVGLGFVASVTHDRGARAILIQAFGTPAGATTDRGVVTGITKSTITLRSAGGGTLTVMLDASTRFRLFGLPAGRRVARPGALVAVTHAGDAPALVVNVLKRAGA